MTVKFQVLSAMKVNWNRKSLTCDDCDVKWPVVGCVACSTVYDAPRVTVYNSSVDGGVCSCFVKNCAACSCIGEKWGVKVTQQMPSTAGHAMSFSDTDPPPHTLLKLQSSTYKSQHQYLCNIHTHTWYVLTSLCGWGWRLCRWYTYLFVAM